METNPQTEFNQSIRQMILENRRETHYSIKNDLLDTLMEICRYIKKHQESTGEIPSFPKNIEGISGKALEKVYELYTMDTLIEWAYDDPDNEVNGLMLDYLGARDMSRNALRNRYPCTFKKWTEQDDQDLRTIYVRQDPDAVDWNELSTMFGRTVNAVKIRLERLGFTLKEPAIKRF